MREQSTMWSGIVGGRGERQPLPAREREAALRRVGPQHGLEVRVGLCRFESRQPSFMHHAVAPDASSAVELVSPRVKARLCHERTGCDVLVVVGLGAMVPGCCDASVSLGHK